MGLVQMCVHLSGSLTKDETSNVLKSLRNVDKRASWVLQNRLFLALSASDRDMDCFQKIFMRNLSLLMMEGCRKNVME